MDTTVEPMVLIIKRAVEDAIGVPAQVVQRPDDVFELTLLPELTQNPKSLTNL